MMMLGCKPVIEQGHWDDDSKIHLLAPLYHEDHQNDYLMQHPQTDSTQREHDHEGDFTEATEVNHRFF